MRIPTLLALLCLPAIPLAQAADGTWDADSDGDWSDLTKWNGGAGPIADGADFTATFADAISADRTVTLNTVRTIGNITFSDTSHHLAISGANTLTLDTTSGTPTINVADEELTIDSVIAGNDGLLKSGNGDFSPRGANTFTGGVDLSAGRITVRDNANEQSFLGDAGNTLTFTGNATFHNVANTVTLPQNFTVNGGVTGTFSGAFGENIDVSGVLAGSGDLIFQGNSAGPTWDFLNTANTFTGSIIKIDGSSGHATLGVSSLLDSPGPTTIGLASDSSNGGQFVYKNAVAPLVLTNRQFELVINGNSGTNFGRQAEINNSASTANTMTINSDLLVTGTGTKNLFLAGGNTGDNTFAGVIPDGSAALSLYKDDGGKWILAGTNTYTGTTTIINGTLEIQGDGTYASINSTDSTPNPLTVNTAATATITGTVSGSMEVIKDGAGTLAVTGSLSQTGGTNVDAGTLSLGDGTNNASLDDFGTLDVASGATVDLNYVGSDTVLVLILNGVAQPAGTYNATSDPTYFTGTGDINCLGGDTTALGVAFWDGGAIDILGGGNAASAGGTGTWDTTILNWDIGTVAHGAWFNTTSATANFNGARGTVTLDADMNIGTLNIEVPNAGGSGYFIGDAAEDNTLTFGGNNTINVTATGHNSSNDATIRAGIAGSPTVNVIKRNNNGAFFALLPPAAVTQTVGTLNMDNSVLQSNSQLRLGGASSGNVLDKVTWTGGNSGHQMQLRKLDSTSSGADGSSWTINQDISLHPSAGGNAGVVLVEEGTLTFSGTDNIVSHRIEIQDGGRMVAQGDWRIHDEDQNFIIKSGGILAPGASVGTMALSWNNTRTPPGQIDFQSGSIYEWEVGAGNTTDVFDIQELGGSDAELLVANGTILTVIDSGGSPSAGDQLTVFTYDTGVVTPNTATLNANMTIDHGTTGWTGGSFVNDGAGTIYITGLSSGGGPVNYASWQAVNGTAQGLALDHDLDGVSNGVEYFLGGPNGNTTGFTATPGVTDTAGTLSVTWTHAADYTGVYGTDFTVETSTTLQGAWTTETVGVNVTITGDDVKYTFPAGTENFARLRVTGP